MIFNAKNRYLNDRPAAMDEQRSGDLEKAPMPLRFFSENQAYLGGLINLLFFFTNASIFINLSLVME